MQAKDLRAKQIDELKKDLSDLKKKLEDTMNQVYKGKEKNLVQAKFIRKDIARVNTVINEKKFLKESENWDAKTT